MKLRTVLSVVVMAAVLAPAGFVSAQKSDVPKKHAPDDDAQRQGHLEVQRDPYIAAPRSGQPRSLTGPIGGTGYPSFQVNVDAGGLNIVGDAANEPSIAVDPTDPLKMVIGWRQFDTITSDFRQAGFGYSADGGRTWTFPGVIEPGIFRSDPVLDADADGNFYYNSLTTDEFQTDFWCHVFKSTDGGATWDNGTYAYGGDKQWQAIDTTDGIGRGNIYASWNDVFSTCSGHFTRSTDGGQSFESCTSAPGNPYWGTVAVGPDGELYISGTGFVVDKSVTARDPGQAVVWQTSTSVDLGGSINFGGGPNPAGLGGQAWVAVDHSDGSSRGNVYLLCSVDPPGPDPADVMFARSTDGGLTFGTPIRVNNDTSTDAWQWFGTMSVAPNGRIDVVWLDTRADPGGYDSVLYYCSSTTAGATWSANEAITAPFDPHIGWPQQDKMGDYFDMVSDDRGADLAYAATFNGEQDVYYVRIGQPHCSDLGLLSFPSPEYGCESSAAVSVRDCNANTNPGLAETLEATVASDTEPTGETITLDETGPDTAVFEGSIILSETDAVGVVRVANADTVTATYIDADNGQGGFGVVVTTEAVVDCVGPVISNVQVIDIGPHTAVISFTTNEPTSGTIRYGDSCATLTGSAAGPLAVTSHEITLLDLDFGQRHYFVVDAVDRAGNPATDDNGGLCYSLDTLALAYEFTMDTDPGWSTEGQWAFGQPTGGGGSTGDPDPTSGYTGTNVYGYNLNGDYGSGLPEHRLTSLPLDCTDYTGVYLTYWRWLGIENDSWDHASVGVSTNGSTYTTLWENTGNVSDGTWVYREFDISAIADGQSTVSVRWTMGTTDGSVQYCGWNIDDVRISGIAPELPCPADLDGSGDVGFGDILTIIGVWGPCPPECPEDLSGNGQVDFADVLAVIGAWGGCPAP
ncbi:MAG: hypothetical protein GY716_19285 [bacterium]|nr:hypothetical protein [bacterium]